MSNAATSAPTQDPFVVFDCSLTRLATGRSCSNLRDLLEAVRTVPEPVLEHHLQRCVLDDHFELNEFPNDLARWCWSDLGAHALGEALGLIDPYGVSSVAQLRDQVAATIEEEIWGQERSLSCAPGLELHLIESRLIAFDTGERIGSPAELRAAVERMPSRSLFFHVHEAHRRNEPPTDDFSAWLAKRGASADLVSGLKAIDFYFLNLSQLRDEIVDRLSRFAA